LIEGGAAMFAAVNINHHIDIIGVVHISPFDRNILRVWVISYDMFARANRAEDLNPWAIIINSAPVSPQVELANIPANIRPMCPTDEYAMSDFRSGWRIHKILVVAAPHNVTLSNIELDKFIVYGNIIINRASPYPPSFNRMAANTIDPAIGASTWAFGSHRWTVNIGNFTKNPARTIIIKIELVIDIGNFIR
jgi:hypothetical protein